MASLPELVTKRKQVLGPVQQLTLQAESSVLQ